MSWNKRIAIIVKLFFSIIVIVFFYWAITNNMLSHITNEATEFLALLKQHITIIFISGGLAVLIAVPLGILVTRPMFKKVDWLIVNMANLGQTIPSLAVLALAMGILGIGIKAAIVALFIYSLLPILQNTIAGLESVNKQTIDAAEGMGLTSLQILWKIELPHAAYSIMAGIRTALVINVGTAALAYLIGGGGLGVWIFTGIQMFDHTYLISGAVPVTVLAIAMDYLLKGVQMMVDPKGLRLARKIQHMEE
ncbi:MULTISPECIES: ABC transporter permease [Clostridia]|uniref:ABC transporter permease n=1 Tax=Clostridia TaxID=186801 RepID=UPI000EA1E2F1|nr:MULTISPECIES: ABC transporter permease [Clostridia]NBJ69930.1 ABC transporter permease [Roseburia sp. 1XD42-34]RKI77504.1 ABC transporter permease [Clostridium sp. 1xD42-85]